MKTMWLLLAAAAVLATDCPVQAQFNPGSNPFPGRPTVPGGWPSTLFGQQGPGIVGNPGPGPFAPQRPGIVGNPGPGPFGRQDPGVPRFPGVRTRPGFPIDVWPGSGPPRFPQVRDPVTGLQRAPTAKDFLDEAMRGMPGGPRPNTFPGVNPGPVPRIPPEFLKNQPPPLDLSKFDFRPPVLPKFEPGKFPGGPAPRHEPVAIPSWLRWEWAVGVFVLSLLAGLVRGYCVRKQVED